MNNKNAQYGTIFKHAGKWSVEFWNPLTGKSEYVGFYETEEEGNKALDNKNFDFFSKYSFLLPKSIGINRTRKNFTFSFTKGNKTINMGQYSSLNTAVESRNNFILKLIS